jgi:hypothetical protein
MVDAQGQFVAPRWQTSCGGGPRAPAEPVDASPDGQTGDAQAKPVGPHDAAARSLDTGVVPYGRCTGRALEAGEAPNLEGPVCAVANTAIPMRGCAPLQEVNPPKNKVTAITVDLTDALTAVRPGAGECLSCGPGVGDIAHFRVELDGSSEPPRTADCTASIPFELPPGKLATFTVTAYGSGASPAAGACTTGDSGALAGTSDGSVTAPADAAIMNGAVDAEAGACGIERQVDKGNRGVWCTRCFGQPVPGVTLRATCDPLAATQRRPY